MISRREWLAICAGSVLWTALVVGWVALVLEVVPSPYGEILSLSVPFGAMVVAGWVLLDD